MVSESENAENRTENDGESIIFRAILFDGLGSRPTPCLVVGKAIEFLVVVTGSELSDTVRTTNFRLHT
jgi:hypothetical protein